jgi:hypothetical protein
LPLCVVDLQVRDDGDIDIDYDDGERETRVETGNYRVVGFSAAAAAVTDEKRKVVCARLRVGEWVTYKYRSTGEKFPGKIVRVDAEQDKVLYTLQYPDGDKDSEAWEADLTPTEVRGSGLVSRGDHCRKLAANGPPCPDFFFFPSFSSSVLLLRYSHLPTALPSLTSPVRR